MSGPILVLALLLPLYLGCGYAVRPSEEAPDASGPTDAGPATGPDMASCAWSRPSCRDDDCVSSADLLPWLAIVREELERYGVATRVLVTGFLRDGPDPDVPRLHTVLAIDWFRSVELVVPLRIDLGEQFFRDGIASYVCLDVPHGIVSHAQVLQLAEDCDAAISYDPCDTGTQGIGTIPQHGTCGIWLHLRGPGDVCVGDTVPFVSIDLATGVAQCEPLEPWRGCGGDDG